MVARRSVRAREHASTGAQAAIGDTTSTGVGDVESIDGHADGDGVSSRRPGRRASAVHLFSPLARRVGHAWLLGTLPLAALLGQVVAGQQAYLVAWVFIGALNVVPALVLSIVAYRRVAAVDKRFWLLFAVGIAIILAIGLLVLVDAFVDVLTAYRWIAVVALGLIGLCVAAFFGALFDLVRSRSNIRVNALDVIESAMLVIAVCAFLPLVWGNRPIVPETLWFTIPASVTTVSVLAGFCCSIAMFRRVRGKMLPDERLGLAIGFVCSLNAVAQMAQGLTGFQLPASPLLVFQAACFGVMLLLPLHLMTNTPPAYDTLPAIEQTRARPLDTIAIALLVPMLVMTNFLHGRLGWAVWYVVAIAIVLLLLATVRGKLAMRETRRLYATVEKAAGARRQLLADVLRSADHDRHRVAAQLHQQATAFYVAFSSFLRLSDQDDASPSVRSMRDDLERQAEELRALMLAVRPLETNERGSSDLSVTIAAYVDNLYADTAPPEVDVRVQDDLTMDWTTETIVMRILQEALRNVAKHAHASRIIVTIEADDAGIALRVVDDGIGFDVAHLVFESGNQYMRDFAAHLGGHVFIESEIGAGTTVRAVLGAAPATTGGREDQTNSAVPDAGGRPLLVLVTDEPGESACESPAGPGPTSSADDRVCLPSRAPFAGVHARLAQRRASSQGRRFLHFKSNASEVVVREVLQVCAAAFVALPLAIGVGLTMQSRVDSAAWMSVSVALFGAVLVSISRDIRHFRRGEWDRFDPRRVLAQQIVGMLATGAFGVATGGHVAIFGPILLVILLIGVITGSRSMITTLWFAATAIVVVVVIITQPDGPTAIWTASFFGLSSGLIAGIVDLIVSRARAGLVVLEWVADFTSFACSIRDWDLDAPIVVEKIASSVGASTVMVYERSTTGTRSLREVARYPDGDTLSPFAESDLRQLAERARVDGEFVTAPPTNGRGRLLAIAVATTSSEIVLAVDVDRVGQRDDAALIAAVSSLASVIDRSGLIEDLLGEARTDPLTGLANRRQLQDYLRQAIGRSERLEEPLAVAMIDLDHFKQFNDRWGHVAGDRVLERFAERLRLRLRATDIATRYGGEEFCLLLPNTTASDAQLLLDELRDAFEPYEGERVSFSAGVAQHSFGESGKQLVSRADAALYRAKGAGRGRTHRAVVTRCGADGPVGQR